MKRPVQTIAEKTLKISSLHLFCFEDVLDGSRITDVRDSLEKCGQVLPIMVAEDEQTVIDGMTRVVALALMGKTEVRAFIVAGAGNLLQREKCNEYTGPTEEAIELAEASVTSRTHIAVEERGAA